VGLFFATKGSRWRNKDNWNSDRALSKWHGVSIDKGGHVLKINLLENRLEGDISTWTSSRLLVNICELTLANNLLYGEIPRAIELFSSLTLLDLSWNQLEGEIPDELGNLAQLEVLRLDNNRLVGTIPTSFPSLLKLRYLDISENRLTGKRF
jgi:LRR receptor-like serine/threonine-protein kinase FLS2